MSTTKNGGGILPIEDVALDVSVQDGEIVLGQTRGGSLTPKAAIETGHRLIAAARTIPGPHNLNS